MTKLDMTEEIRRVMQETTNSTPDEDLPMLRWNTQELQAQFEVLGFAAPFVVVRHKETGKHGTLQFKHSPRVYFGWQED